MKRRTVVSLSFLPLIALVAGIVALSIVDPVKPHKDNTGQLFGANFFGDMKPTLSRSIGQWRMRILASPPATARSGNISVGYELIAPDGAIGGQGVDGTSPSSSDSTGTPRLHLLGSNPESPAEFTYQVLGPPAIVLVRITSGHVILDSMRPVSIGAFRFVELAVIHGPSRPGLVAQGLTRSGRVIATDRVNQ
jgi:hypothetical protein